MHARQVTEDITTKKKKTNEWHVRTTKLNRNSNSILATNQHEKLVDVILGSRKGLLCPHSHNEGLCRGICKMDTF